ncbi:hypothetical protein [Bacillus sp. FJAT-50079]|uniref:hypothetical protein n=1 Tax=Bacillus sp. FJAT-50079 TaxID=2833577 RepID=UPI001BC94DD7|nr:hypothetical protein [Bacillus sp. FJAT-50079]MBS4206491.1 hypothetical protein [Bacillus sp. FJAT-50079]
MDESVYFSDNFFSAGTTTIFNNRKEPIGSLDLKSAFTSSLAVQDLDGNMICEGKFRTFSNRWVISNPIGEIGELRQRFSFFSKKFIYSSYSEEAVEIESDAFSREYRIIQRNGDPIAQFYKINGFFQNPSFQLTNLSKDSFSSAELICVVMGVHMINKRAASSHTTTPP